MDISLLYKLYEHALSPEEEEEIRLWARKDARRQTYVDKFIKHEQGEAYSLSESKKGLYRTDFLRHLRTRRRKRMREKSWRIAYGAVAATVLALLSFYGLYKGETRLRLANLTNVPQLEYENCSVDLKLPKESTGKVTMEVSSEGMKEIIVGRGAEFKVQLEDGTSVWLNSDTRLCYPERFGGTERKVLLEGEAYFSVEKDRKRPFIVEAQGVSIKVYGTEFNVSARKKACVATTLVRGSVSVRLEGERQETVLTPGLTAEVNPETHRLNVCLRHTDLYAGWKDGKFSFEDAPLKELLAEVALWYDLQVDFESPEAGEERFTGSLSRHLPLVDLLRVLQSTTYVSFHLQERKLTVGKDLQTD